MRILLPVFALALGSLFTSPALAVRGEWETDPDRALAEAEKSKTPILAVAMDHG
jgi:hypothetical protein